MSYRALVWACAAFCVAAVSACSGGNSTMVDPCSVNNGGCDIHATCATSDAGIICTCQNGWSGDGTACTPPADGCANGGGCPPNTICQDIAYRGVTCTCDSDAGYIGDGGSCFQLDPCKNGVPAADGGAQSPCDPNATCTSTSTSYSCTCNPGFEGTGVPGPGGPGCTPRDYCVPGVCDRHATCTSVPGSYICTCDRGWEGDGGTCTSMDFCGLGMDDCDPNANCTDTPGSFTCACKDGFTGDGGTCTPIDYCGLGMDNCDPNAACADTPGSFSCTCNAGYTGDGTTCAAIDYCGTHQDKCDSNATCTDVIGSYHCACNTGYTGDGFTCTHVNECANGMAQCPANSSCIPTPTSYVCVCNTYYQMVGTQCEPVDWCGEGGGGCDPNASCTNQLMGASCACNPGYTGDGIVCTPYDFCGKGVPQGSANPTPACDSNATCADTPGSYACTCNSGYYGGGTPGKCWAGTDPCVGWACQPHATCSSATGSPVCACDSGYWFDGKLCQPDLCATNNGGCDANATCTNSDSGPVCTCKSGWMGNGTTCTSVDFCGKQLDQCSAFATCMDTPGSYSCACNAGYTGDGVACMLANPCLVNYGGCDVHAYCTNNGVGTATCTCQPGYLGDGHTCTRTTPCTPGDKTCSTNGTCTPIDATHDVCLCNQGYQGDGVTCTSIPYCEEHLDNCDPTATCTDTAGSFKCTCPQNFTSNNGGQTCTAINHCTDGSLTCDSNATCHYNGPGTGQCICNQGYIGNGMTCSQIDYCGSMPTICGDGTCSDTMGSYLCTCPTGQFFDGTTCNTNYCKNNGLTCSSQATCQGTGSSATCVCNAGYTGDGTTCTVFYAGMAAGEQETCGIRADGSLWCWGALPTTTSTNGSNVSFSASAINTSSNEKDWAEIYVGAYENCALKSDASGWCWQTATLSMNGNGYSISPTEIVSAGRWTQLSVGATHACGIQANGSLWCWGDNSKGALGIGTTSGSSVPVAATQVGSGTWTQVSAGNGYTCGVLSDGSLWCWGSDGNGNLGIGSGGDLQNTPVNIASGTQWSQVAAGQNHTCGVQKNGTLWCWGANPAGALGTGGTAPSASPVQVGSATDWAQVAVNDDDSINGSATCAVKTGGTLWCWGSNALGQLANGTMVDSPTPGQVGSLATWAQVQLGAAHACALGTDHSLWCWGSNEKAELGIGVSGGSEALTPSQTNGSGWTAVSGAYHSTCGLGVSGSLWCWGEDFPSTGALGDSECRSKAVPYELTGTGWSAISQGNNHGCALKADGTAWCWGSNSQEDLGNQNAPSPGGMVQVTPPTTTGKYASICTGGPFGCGVATDGTLWCWGDDAYGEVGVPTSTPTFPLPVTQVGAATNWSSVTCGQYQACGLRADGTLWCWGGLGAGQTNETSPTQVGAGVSWIDVSAAGTPTCAIRSDHTLWCWNGPFATAPSPLTEIGTDPNWASVVTGDTQACAIKMDGSLYCGGVYFTGFNGITSTSYWSSTDMVLVDPGPFVSVAPGQHGGCAAKTDGTAWCWGSNGYGELGNGTAWSTTVVSAGQ